MKLRIETTHTPTHTPIYIYTDPRFSNCKYLQDFIKFGKFLHWLGQVCRPKQYVTTPFRRVPLEILSFGLQEGVLLTFGFVYNKAEQKCTEIVSLIVAYWLIWFLF